MSDMQSREPSQTELDAFIARAGFRYGWMNLESWARRMAEQAEREAAMGGWNLTNVLPPSAHERIDMSIVERLREDAEHHRTIAHHCDCVPEATINWEHANNAIEAAEKITDLEKSLFAAKMLIQSMEKQAMHIEKQREQWLEARNTLESEREANEVMTERIAHLEAENARLRKDAERYRVLRDSKYQLADGDICVSDSFFTQYFGEELDAEVDALRVRCDAAMIAEDAK